MTWFRRLEILNHKYRKVCGNVEHIGWLASPEMKYLSENGTSCKDFGLPRCILVTYTQEDLLIIAIPSLMLVERTTSIPDHLIESPNFFLNSILLHSSLWYSWSSSSSWATIISCIIQTSLGRVEYTTLSKVVQSDISFTSCHLRSRNCRWYQ